MADLSPIRSAVPSAVSDTRASAFSLAALRYLADHAIDPAVAAGCGVRESAGALMYPYRAVDGRTYLRSRRLGPGENVTLQPANEPLTLWWPAGPPPRRGMTVVVCEGEPDALAALTALRGPDGDDAVAVCAVPGASFPVERLLEQLAAHGPALCVLMADADDAGQRFAAAALAAAERSAVPLRVCAAQLADGADLADTLRDLDPVGPSGGFWLRSLLLDLDAELDARALERDNATPVERRVSDRANAQRLVDAHHPVIRFCHDERAWRIWDGRRWNADTDERMTRLAIQTAARIYDEAERAVGDDRKLLLCHAQRSESAARLRAMVELAKADDRVTAQRADFDSDAMLVNCANGVIDLRTGRLLDHDPQLQLSHLVGVPYQPDQQDGMFTEFVWDCVDGDERYFDWLRRAVGYSLTGDVSEEALFLLHGPGGTGKSTLLSALQGVWGTYSRSADVSTFVHQQAGRPRNDVARLRDARLVAVSEVDERAELAAALIKRLTGGDTVAARFLFQEDFEFRPALKLWVASNHLPAVDSRDSGMFRRLRIVPFAHQPRQVRPQLKRDLCDLRLCGPEILAFAVTGALDWQRRPLSVDMPEQVIAAGQQFAWRSDPVGAWLSQRTEIDPDARTAASELFDDFQRTRPDGARAVTQTEFGRRLKAAGVPSTRAASGVRYSLLIR